MCKPVSVTVDMEVVPENSEVIHDPTPAPATSITGATIAFTSFGFVRKTKEGRKIVIISSADINFVVLFLVLIAAFYCFIITFSLIA